MNNVAAAVDSLALVEIVAVVGDVSVVALAVDAVVSQRFVPSHTG